MLKSKKQEKSTHIRFWQKLNYSRVDPIRHDGDPLYQNTWNENMDDTSYRNAVIIFKRKGKSRKRPAENRQAKCRSSFPVCWLKWIAEKQCVQWRIQEINRCWLAQLVKDKMAWKSHCLCTLHVKFSPLCSWAPLTVEVSGLVQPHTLRAWITKNTTYNTAKLR